MAWSEVARQAALIARQNKKLGFKKHEAGPRFLVAKGERRGRLQTARMYPRRSDVRRVKLKQAREFKTQMQKYSRTLIKPYKKLSLTKMEKKVLRGGRNLSIKGLRRKGLIP